MQLITTRNKEISFVELKKAISSGNGLELIRPGDKFAIELKNGEHVNAVCGGYVNEKRARFVLEDCLADKWRMNDTPTNKGGYGNTNEKNKQAQYAYYSAGNSKIKYKHNGTSTAARWWLRSPSASASATFVIVYADGTVYYCGAYYSLGFAPGFCV